MKQTFTQFLIESKIKIPQTTFQQAMSTVASAYFSHLRRLYAIDGEEPPMEYEKALEAARERYGDVNVYSLTKDHPGLFAKIKFITNELPERYRKNIRNRDFVIKLWAGPRNIGKETGDNDGEYVRKSMGDAAQINVNIAATNPEKAVYDPKLIPQQLHYLESIVDHELQHMVQDVALKKLHPSQSSTDEDRLKYSDNSELYYNSQEEFSPQLTSVSAQFRNEIKGLKDRNAIQNAFYDAVDPKRGKAYPFFSALYKTDTAKWKKAVKEFHGLVQSNLT